MSDPERLAGRFVIGELLGTGGMGEVYAAFDEREARHVAVKRLRRGLGTEPELLERFAREGAILRATSHPNIVSVLAVLNEPDGPSIVMEYVSGGDLEQRLSAEGRLPIDRVLSLALDLADALSRAHRLGIVHRDLKPANVLLCEDGTPRLTDFGIAHLAGSPEITAGGAVIGTLAYLSPEAWDGSAPDARNDVWSFGVMLYEMLAGRRPFEGIFPGLLHAAIVTSDPPPLRKLRPEVPQSLADAIGRMLEKDIDRRMASVRELGVIVERLLRGDAASPAIHARPASLALGTLPTPTTRLVGRASEISQVLALLQRDDVRLLTLTGPGGSGKTRLALEIAARLAERCDATYFVDLTPVTDPALVLPTLARALDVEEDLLEPLETLVVRRLASQRALLVLDNFEQVVAAAPQVARLLLATPKAKLLVTSRFALRVAAEQEYYVPPFGIPDEQASTCVEGVLASEAGAFFVDRVRAVSPSFTLDASSARDVAEICRRLDGLPLALSLAAARVRVLPLPHLLARLAAPLELLTSGAADGADHQRSLRATMEWSYGLLGQQDRLLFRHLGALVGAFTIDDAAALMEGLNGDWSIPALVDVLQSLVEKSLLGTIRDGDEPRFGMLQTLREFAVEQLQRAGEIDAARARHAQHFAKMAFAWSAQVSSSMQADALAHFAHAHDNLRTALGWALVHDTTLHAELLAAMGAFWYHAGHWNEALDRFRLALAELQIPPAAAAAILDQLGRLEMFLGDETSAREHHARAVERANESSVPALMARCREGMGEVLLKIGDVAGALEVLEESERIARAAGEPGVLAMCLTTLGTARVAADEHERAERELSGALDIARAEGDPFLLTKIHYYLAGLALLRGDADQARALCDAATRSARDSGDRSWVHHVDEMRARTLPLQAREEAIGLARASLQAFHEAGSRSCFPHSFEVRARLLASAAEGDSVPLAAAARLVGAADGVCARLSIAMLPVERALLNQTRGTVRDRLGVSAFDAAYADGFAWTDQMAVERASA